MKKFISIFFTLFCFALCVQSQEIEVPQEQKSLVTKLTATWCPICGGSAWDVFDNFVNNLETKAVVFAAHYSGSSNLHSSAAVDLIRNHKGSPSGQPIFYHNRDKIQSDVENSITGRVNDAHSAGGPVAQTGMRLEYDPMEEELVIKTKTQFFKDAEGTYYLSILLIEKEVVADQSGRGSSVVHKRVLRRAITTETLGEELASGNMSDGASYDMTARIPMISREEADKYQVATIIWKKENGFRDFINANFSGEIEERTVTPTFAIKSEGPDLRMHPNPMIDQAILQITSPKPLRQFQLSLYASDGRLLANWAENNYSGNEFKTRLDRGLLPRAGVYFLKLTSEGGSFSKKMVVQ